MPKPGLSDEQRKELRLHLGLIDRQGWPSETSAAIRAALALDDAVKAAVRLAEWEGLYVGRDAVADRVELGVKFLDILHPNWRESPERALASSTEAGTVEQAEKKNE